MIPFQFVILYRAAIIVWVTVALMPVEVVFDAVEDELNRQGVEL
jgi:hypothetical protein